ncbi:MAG: hypothetical protein K2F67_08160, partial [Eubacterium sp.]|nr:hypothetical protein [Eubacterium sp.]
MKKLLSVFLSLLMLLSITAGIDFSAYAQNNSFEIYETNPIYSFFGISSSEQSSQRKVFARAAETDKSDVLYSVEEAADYVREHMISREGEIIVRLQSTEDDFSLLVKSIFEAAISNDLSKCSLDGDYLKYNWSNYGASGLYYIYPDYYLYEITFNIAYNTTAAQELAVQNEVEKIIRDNKLEGKSDYAKIKSIHNIICERIKYDYDNMNNLDYRLQFSAYAALFDGKSVCQGYALLFHILAKQLGLDTRIIAGPGHAWNIVKLDGQYYEVDCTWDDTSYDNPNASNGDYWSKGKVIYDYFLCGSTDFEDHIREDEYNTAEFNKAYPMAKTKYICSHSRTVWQTDDEASCKNGFVKTKICLNCEVIFDKVVISPQEHSYEDIVVAPTNNEQGYTKHICSVCGDTYIDSYTGYGSDNSALIAVLSQIESYSSEDYSETSFDNLSAVYERYLYLADENVSQREIDKAVFDLIVAISDLEPYFNLSVSAPNGSFTVSYNDETSSMANHKLLFGTSVSLSAAAKNGYEFIGWYDVTNNLYFSDRADYTFKITCNTKLKAVFVKENSATLTFTTYSNWVQKSVTKTISEWNNINSIEMLLPEVPYKYGYSNGRWVYNNAEILARLRTGENVSLIPEYDEDDTSLPTPPAPIDGVPSLDLYYKLDEKNNNTASFVMAAGIPDDCKLEGVGVA